MPRVQPAESAQRSAPREQAVEEQAYDDRGKGERRVDDGEGGTPAPEATRREEIAERQADRAGNEGRDERDLQRQQRDPEDFGITRYQQ